MEKRHARDYWIEMDLLELLQEPLGYFTNEERGWYFRLLAWGLIEGITDRPAKEQARLVNLWDECAERRRFVASWTTGTLSGLFERRDDGRIWAVKTGLIVGTRRRTDRDYRVPLAPSVKAKVLAAKECRFCGSTENLHVDHIKPVRHGGTNHINNLQCLCRKCNVKKGAKWTGRKETQVPEVLFT